MRFSKQRAVDHRAPAGGQESKLMWLVPVGVVLVIAGLVTYLTIETPRGERHERAQVAAQQLAGWVRQAGFEPTQIDVAFEPTPGTVMGRGGGGVSRSPRVLVLVEQVPVAVTWMEPRSEGSQGEGTEYLEVGDQTLELKEATHQEGRASARFDCGPTSLHVLVDPRGDLDADELPPEGGRNEVLAVATSLAETVPCPVRHPNRGGRDVEADSTPVT